MKHFKFIYTYKGKAISEDIFALSKVLALKAFTKLYPVWTTFPNLEIIRVR